MIKPLLLKSGWSETQATALAELIGGAPGGRPWGSDGCATEWRRERLHDVAARHGWEKNSLAGQIAFLTYDLKVNMPKIHSQMVDTSDHKKSVEEIRLAVAPYFDRLKADRR